MGWFDGASSVGGHSTHGDHHHHSSGSIFGGGGGHHSSSKHHSSGSIFGSGDHKHNSSRSSFFGFPRSSSYYRRSPRSGYLRRIYSQLRRLLRDLIYYMKRHPMKVFMLVIMPLITGGALTGLLARFGIRLPGGVERMFGGMGGRGMGIGRGMDGGLQFERRRGEEGIGGLVGELGRGMGGGMGGGLGGGIGSAIGIAKMFM